MKLAQLLTGIDCQVVGTAEVEIGGIHYDSRKVGRGDLFVALPGKHVDGKQFAAAAVAAGAAAVLCDARIEGCAATQVIVPDPLLSMADLCAAFYDHPDRRLCLVGITGTNGKTTTTYLLEHIFEMHQRPAGVIGTVNYRFGDTVIPAPNTTPQSADLYRFFDSMVKAQRKVAIMEVSSHALALGRVRGLEFDIAIFSNLTRDHLDFHKTMEEYYEAKRKLFTGLVPGSKAGQKFAIINIDDPWGKKLASEAGAASVVTYGIREKAAVRAENIRISSRSTEFNLVTPAGHKKVHLSHLGQHNVYNALACAAAALAAGIPFEGVVAGLESAPAVPGRLQRVDAGQNFTVVVDYAHTDDALQNVLKALTEMKTARIITVFGCGGDRDRSKRPLMGEVATACSDYVFVTSDNPRTEQPEKIALDIEVGIRRQHRTNYQVLLDREQAIAAAIGMARKGDIILIAGKGHENYQILGETKIHFDDVEIARKYIEKLAGQKPQ